MPQQSSGTYSPNPSETWILLPALPRSSSVTANVSLHLCPSLCPLPGLLAASTIISRFVCWGRGWRSLSLSARSPKPPLGKDIPITRTIPPSLCGPSGVPGPTPLVSHGARPVPSSSGPRTPNLSLCTTPGSRFPADSTPHQSCLTARAQPKPNPLQASLSFASVESSAFSASLCNLQSHSWAWDES